MISKINLDIVKSYKFISLLTIIIFTILNWNPLNSFFSQDDFFHLRAVMDKKITDIPSYFLGMQKEYSFYRPISREAFNFLIYKSFGFNAFIFHLINAGLIIFNGALLYKLLKLFNFTKKVSLFALVIYLISPIHNIELYYLASIQNLLTGSFLLLGLVNYKNFLEDRKKYSYFSSILFFILGLMSHESAVVFIPIVFTLEITNFNKLSLINFKDAIFRILPFLLVLGIRMVLYIQNSGVDQSLSYQPTFLIGSIFNTLAWFILWSFGLPEMLVDFMTLKLEFNPNFFKYYSYYAKMVFPALIAMVFSLIYCTYSLRRNLLKNNHFFFLLCCYFFSLSPFLLFPNHKFIYYLSFPIVFFAASFGILLANTWNANKTFKFLTLILIISYLIISFQTKEINKITYWAAKRAEAAKFIIKTTKEKFPEVKEGQAFYIRNDPNYPVISKEWGSSSKQAFYILSGSDAFKLLYKDPEIKVYFEDIDNKDGRLKLDKMRIIQPEFPY